MHDLTPTKVLRLATALGSPVKQLRLVGCEPATMPEPDDMQMGLSEPVHAAVDEAVNLILSLLTDDERRDLSPPLACEAD